MTWYKEILPGWALTHHPLGTGYALIVERGIPCEGHYHVLTKHENGCLNLEEQLEHVVDTKDWPKEAIEGFTAMIQALAKTNGYRADIEVLSAAFMAALLERFDQAIKQGCKVS